MPSYYYSFMREWGSWICGMGMVLFWMISFVLGYMLLKQLCPHFSKKSEQECSIDNPMEAIKSRYANGEIDKVELQEKKKDIEG